MRSRAVAALGGVLAGPGIVILSSLASVKLALAAIVGAFASLWIVSVPLVGYLLTASMIPLERFGRFTDDSSLFTISLMRLVGVLTLAGIVLHLLLTRQRPRFGHLFWLYAAYVLWALASALHSSDFEESLRAGGQLVGNLLFFYVVVTIARNFKLAQWGTMLWLAATVLIGVYTIYDWHLGDKYTLGSPDEGLSTSDRWRAVGLDRNEWESLDVVPRAIGSTTHSAVYGINLITAVPFFIFYVRDSRSKLARLLWLVLLGIVAYNVLLTNTRSVLLTFAVVLGLCWLRGLLVIRWPWIVAAAVAGLCLLPWADLSAFRRILDPANYTIERSATLRHRMTYWRAGLLVARDHWLTGVGMGNENEIPKYLKGDYTAVRTTVHNEYLQTFMELGIIGFALFFGFVGCVVRDSIAAARVFRTHALQSLYWYTIACQVTLVTVLIYGIQCDVFRFPLKVWWFVAAVTVLLRQLSQRLAVNSLDPLTLGERDAWAV